MSTSSPSPTWFLNPSSEPSACRRHAADRVDRLPSDMTCTRTRVWFEAASLHRRCSSGLQRPEIRPAKPRS